MINFYWHIVVYKYNVIQLKTYYLQYIITIHDFYELIYSSSSAIPSRVLSPSYSVELVVVVVVMVVVVDCTIVRLIRRVFNWFFALLFNVGGKKLVAVCFWEPFGLPIGFVQATSLKGVLVLEADAVNELAMEWMESLLMLSERLEGRDGVEQIDLHCIYNL